MNRLVSVITRHCQISMATASEWGSEFVLDDFCLAELHFFWESVIVINTKQFFKPIASHSKIVYSDYKG